MISFEKMNYTTGKEFYNSCKKSGYRELQTEEMREKECYRCSHFAGGIKDEGCWCSEKMCDWEENKFVLSPQKMDYSTEE